MDNGCIDVYGCIGCVGLWTKIHNMSIRSVEKRATESKNRPKLFPPKNQREQLAEEMIPTRRD